MSDETFTLKLPNMDPNKADQLFFLADEKIKQGLFAEAKALFEEAISINPQHGRSHNHLGWIYETKYQDFAQAEDHYKKAIEYAPEYPSGYTNYAILLSKLERHEDFKKHFEKALGVPGINKETLYNENGIVEETEGRFDEAIASYKRAMQYSLSEQGVKSYQVAIERCTLKMK